MTNEAVALEALWEALAELDRGELLLLGATRSANEEAARNAAWSTARSAAARLARTDELARLEADIVRWADTGGARSGVYAFASPAGDLLLADLRRQAIPAVFDAAAALLLGDALDDTSRRMLLTPWRRLKGRRR